ncbi:MAG: IPT/TIG domain-containing protein [Leptospiraceae bacterium]|nr:IPT/TIG domain-containing protein [Leptospiraceae bacterium]
MKQFFLALILFSVSVFSESSTTLSSRDIPLEIDFFSPKDLLHETYSLTVKSKNPQEIIEILKGNRKEKWEVIINETKTDFLLNTLEIDHNDPDAINFEVKAYSNISVGTIDVKILLIPEQGEKSILAQKNFEFKSRNSSPGKQPIIHDISPEAGKRGDTITITGVNFGSNIDDIEVIIGELKTNEKGSYVEEVVAKRPSYLSLEQQEKQYIRFDLPTSRDLLGEVKFRKEFFLQVVVGARPSNHVKIVALTESWKYWIAGISIGVQIILYFGLVLILKKFNFLDMILIDKSTYTYSLSRFQAVIWTVTLTGSYLYVALCNGLLLGNGIIPDFNPTLTGLMSISYGGLVAAGGLSSKRPKNEILRIPPSLSNLFCSGGSIDIARLQLFGFTIIAIIIYLYNLVKANPLNGLPDIPVTLLGLLGVSQTGYLGGKFVGDKTVVNQVKPSFVPSNRAGVKINIFGAGFVPKTKILFDEHPDPVLTDFISASVLSVKIPALSTPGKKRLTVIPPDTSSITTEECFEVISIQPDTIAAYEEDFLLIQGADFTSESKISIYGEGNDPIIPRFEILDDDLIELNIPALPPGNKWLTIQSSPTSEIIEIENAFNVVEDVETDPETEDAEPPTESTQTQVAATENISTKIENTGSFQLEVNINP